MKLIVKKEGVEVDVGVGGTHIGPFVMVKGHKRWELLLVAFAGICEKPDLFVEGLKNAGFSVERSEANLREAKRENT